MPSFAECMLTWRGWKREAEKAKQRADEPPLNPPFPHKRQAFDPFFFSLERETPDEEKARKERT